MAREGNVDKLSLKNLLFSKAIQNHTIPVPTEGYDVNTCKDCGNRFIFESSYEYHVNRKSVLITYMCRPCNQVKTFNNRCNLLAHIRSHAFKTATINVSDLKIEPLPLTHFNLQDCQSNNDSERKKSQLTCYDCQKDIYETGVKYKDREKHLMQFSTEVHSCPVCLFALPTVCALKAHLRLHLKTPPYCCPECGITLAYKAIQYPYNHFCEGFKMMRATARYKCPVTGCELFHPSDFEEHIRKKHIKKIYLKCSLCHVAGYDEASVIKGCKDANLHKTQSKILTYYQCDLCPGSTTFSNLSRHIETHDTKNFVYPCWTCGGVFTIVSSLLLHHKTKHLNDNIGDKNNIPVNKSENNTERKNVMCRVVKKCEKCKRCFTYKCKYDQIAILPNQCPYKCLAGPKKSKVNSSGKIICGICNQKTSADWNKIKSHFGQNHTEHVCLDVQVKLPKMNTKTLRKYEEQLKRLHKIQKKKLRKQKKKQKVVARCKNTTHETSPKLFSCTKCNCENENKEQLEEHLLIHRDPCMAYQCLECGQCFVVKPSFATHLLVEHNISDIEDYINKKQCYNESALEKTNFNESENNEPIRENQCSICRDQFENGEDLEKHFRVHGMAFLLKNTAKNSSS